MAVQLKKFLPLALFFLPFFAHASTISIPSNNLGLVGYWPLNEGSGSTAHDLSGSGNNGALSGSPAWVTGESGKALQFNSTSQYITTGYTIPAQSSATSFTWSTWIKQTTTGGTQVILGFRNGSTWVKLTPSAFEYSSGGIISYTLPSGQWVLATIVKSGTSFTYYINGAVVGTATNSGSVVSHTFFIGSDPGFSDGTPQYSLDDVRVYNRALSASEVANLYDANRALMSASYSPGTLAQGLVGWWPFDGKTITSNLQDMSGQGNNGFLSGFTSTSTAETIGKMGQALNFSGNQQVNVGNISPTKNYPYSVSVWFKVNTLVSNSALVNKYASGTWNGFNLFFVSGQLCSWYLTGTTNNNYTAIGQAAGVGTVPCVSVSTGVWHHVVVTVSSSGMSMYVDGALAQSAGWIGSVGNSSESTTLSFGHYNSYFNGLIDDVRIYNRALSASEVTQLYNVGQGAHINDSGASLDTGSIGSGLLGYWTFDGKDMISNVKDESGNGSNAFLAGVTSTSSVEGIGKLGQALVLNGSSYALTSALSSIPSSVTIAAWIKPQPAGGVVISELGQGGGWHDSEMEVETNNTIKVCVWSGGESCVNAATGITYGKWYHVLLDYSSSTHLLQAYVNGALSTSTALTKLWPSSALQYGIGKSDSTNGGDGSAFSGSIDDVRVYNRPLSASEALQLYNLGH